MWDPSPDLPVVGPPIVVPAQADSGRGMLILDTVADRWGGCAIGEGAYGPGGKTMWFELALPKGSPPALAA
ncbi:hypothetical protein [Streptomyces sp. NPDC048641]|uniref:hypothetical protein n=1 Tax=unclassified Streptomyces TaxID=2593676 RepID=UPI00342E2BBB